MKLRISLVFLFLLFSAFGASAQTPLWAHSIGAGGVDVGQGCRVTHSGNVVVAGKFSGTVDIDPGPGVYNIVSAGNTDIFLACYTPAGGFLWGFGIGGPNYDGALNLAIDPSDNVILCGFYQSDMDFDPGAGVFTIPFVGGTSVTWEGDGFVAKYSSTGVFQWAKGLGGPLTWDRTGDVGTDDAGNVYAGGCFNGSMAVAGGPTFTTTAAGDAYLIKYSPSGAVIWAHHYGQVGTSGQDCGVASLAVSGGNIYVTGWFKNTADFSPWSTSTILTTSSPSDYNSYVAKYDISGNCLFALQIAGTGSEGSVALALDAAENVYVTGNTTSPGVTFSPGSPPVSAPGGGVNQDMFLVKYSSTGALVWANVLGGPGDDGGWAVDINGSFVYTTGQMMNTVDFDPSGAVANLVSAGSQDGYIVKYDLDGNYLCGFRFGGAAGINDIGCGITHDASGFVYTTGFFGGIGTDFDPSPAAITSLSSAGSADIYLIKYPTDCSSLPAVCNSLTLPDTISLCPGDTMTIPAMVTGSNPVLDIEWTPTTGLSDPTILNPLLTAITSGWYYLTFKSLLPANLVVNGDFSAGNVGFTSSYTYAAPPSTTLVEGNYSVFTNPNGVHTGFTSFGDHTTGTGNMMILNAASTPVDVYCQTITVIPYTDYNFSAWFANCSAVTTGADVPILQFKINGVLQGVPVTVTAPPGVWVNFFITWNSGTSTSATICINDASTTASGNDFVIDDISFQQVCEAKDSVYLNVLLPGVTTFIHRDSICSSAAPLTLTAPGTGFTSRLWSTGSTGGSISVGTSGTYWLKSANNCSIRIDTFHVVFNPTPIVNLGNDTGFCTGNTYILSSVQPAGSVYAWSTGSAASSIAVTSSGSYMLTVTNIYGCVGSDIVNIVVSPPVPVNLGPDTIECEGIPLTLQSAYAYIGATYFWDDASATATRTVAATGTYWLQVKIGGCTGVDTIHVAILYDTFRLHNSDTAICLGRHVQALISGNPAITYQWTPTAGIPVSDISSPMITPDTSAMYVVTAHMAGCPDKKDSLFIDVQPVPDVFIGNNRQVCEFDTLHMNAFVGPQWYTHYSYSWTPGAQLNFTDTKNVIFTAVDTSILILTVTTPAGCKGVDSTMIIVYPANFGFVHNDTDVCPRDSLKLWAAGGVSYKWSPSTYLDDPLSVTPWVKAVTTQVYTVLATSEFGCLDTLTVKVTVRPDAVIKVPDSVTIAPGESYQIHTQTNCSSLVWTPPGGLDNRYASDPISTPVADTRYTVYGVTEWGCKTVDSIDIIVDPHSMIAVPNAFAPGSGKLFVKKKGLVKLNYFRIYNRWGDVVFQTTNMDEGWDGTYKGTPQALDVFVYTVEATTSTGEVITKSGNVTLLR